ncbi:response regulator [Marinomonas balearica]|uniref:Two-component system OmpR family response regulator n=1 Tax=Marinomonas balearica TaxID=491947 RepID=A0A4R6MHJ1_9GAMM|nr:response regulator [Marinomonas balearica]TDP01224.1 two-component system OmpR family response regulator [Marinomonas balearica]
MTELSKKTLLVVDDDQDIRELLCDVLSQKGYVVITAENGADMWPHLQNQMIDLVLMDLFLQEEDGLQLARQIREQHAMPIMMLTGKGDETDRILGLELAADDYMMKPFNIRELTARIYALLRRASAIPVTPNSVEEEHECLRFGNWILDRTARTLKDIQGKQISLTHGEFSLLEVLVMHPDRVLTREQIIDYSRGLETEVSDRTVDVLILRLRRKIEVNPKTPEFVKTQRGIGYLFQGPVRKN